MASIAANNITVLNLFLLASDFTTRRIFST
jgi:hypothetical protein